MKVDVKPIRYLQVINAASQDGSGGSVQRSESSSHDHPDLSQLSSENVSADQVMSYIYMYLYMYYLWIPCPPTFGPLPNALLFMEVILSVFILHTVRVEASLL